MMWESDIRSSLERLKTQGFSIERLFSDDACEFPVDRASDLLGVIFEVSRKLYGEPTDLGIGTVLKHEGLPIEAIGGFPLVFDVTIPKGEIHVRSHCGKTEQIFRFDSGDQTPKPN